MGTVFNNNTIIEFAELGFFQSVTGEVIFNSCSSLKKIEGNGVIRANCYSCVNLVCALNISANINSRFARCTKFEYFTTPSGRNTFSENVTFWTTSSGMYEYCSKFVELVILATTPPSIGNSNFFRNSASGLKIYVPDNSVSSYKSASNYPAAKIYPLSERQP